MKNNKSLIITIVIMALLIVGLGSYIVYDKFIKEEPKIEEKESNKEEEKDNNKKEDNKEESPSNIKIDKYEFEEYKVISETKKINNKQHEIKTIIYKQKENETNDLKTFSIFSERVLLDGKEIIPLVMIGSYYEDDSSSKLEEIVKRCKKNYDIQGLKDSLGNYYYIVEYGYENLIDEEYIDSKESLKVLKEDFNEIYSMNKNCGRPFIWLHFDNENSAGDRNVTCDEEGCVAYQYNNRGFGGGIDYDVHDDFFYTFENFDIKDDNCNEVATAKEYKITVNDGKVIKELVKSYDSSKDKELEFEHAC